MFRRFFLTLLQSPDIYPSFHLLFDFIRDGNVHYSASSLFLLTIIMSGRLPKI